MVDIDRRTNLFYCAMLKEVENCEQKIWKNCTLSNEKIPLNCTWKMYGYNGETDVYLAFIFQFRSRQFTSKLYKQTGNNTLNGQKAICFPASLRNFSLIDKKRVLTFQLKNKPLRDKTNKMTVNPAPSLIRVFAVCMKKYWVLSYPLSAQQRFWSD